MKNKNLIWIGVGVVLAYLIFRPKKAAAQDKLTVGGTGSTGPGLIAGPTGYQVKAAAMTNEQLKSWYCRPKLGGPGYVVRPSEEEKETDKTVEAEMKKRGLDNSCPGRSGNTGLKTS